MSWWDDLRVWFADQLRAALGWITEQLNAAAAWLAQTRLKFKFWLADYLATDAGLITFFSILALGAVILPKMAAWLVKTKFVQNILLFVSDIKLVLGNVLLAVQAPTITLIHQFLYSFWDEYTQLWDAYYQALGAVCEELGQGVGSLTAVFQAYRGMVYSAYGLAGKDPLVSEAIYFSKIADFMEDIRDKMLRWAANPALMWSDINTELIQPVLNDLTESQAGLANTIVAINEQIIATTKNVTDFIDSVEAFKNSFPEEITEVLDERFGEFFDNYNSFKTEYIEKFEEWQKGLSDYLTYRLESGQVFNLQLLRGAARPELMLFLPVIAQDKNLQRKMAQISTAALWSYRNADYTRTKKIKNDNYINKRSGELNDYFNRLKYQGSN